MTRLYQLVLGLVIVAAMIVSYPLLQQQDGVLLAKDASQTDATTPATANRDANIRTGPGTNFSLTGTVLEGDEFDIVAQNDTGNWYLLATGEWIAAFLVADAPTGLPSTVTVNRNANLRAGPSTDTDIVGRAPAGQVVALLGATADGEWYLLQTGEWIAAFLVSNAPDQLPLASADSAAPAATPTAVAEEEAEPTPTVVEEEPAPTEAAAAEEPEATSTPVEEEEVAEDAAEPTPTAAEEEEAEPTPTPVAEAEAEPTPTPVAEEEVEPIPALSPEVTIPRGWTAVADDRLGYSLAIPPGWTEFDLRGPQIAQLAAVAGQAQALGELQTFLATEEGQAIGVVAIQPDLFGMMQGLIPPGLNVSVIPLPPGFAHEDVVALVNANMSIADQFGDAEIEPATLETINNLPAVVSSAAANLSEVGLNQTVMVQAVGLLADDSVYLLTLVARDASFNTNAAIFEQIIGTFRPE